MVDILCYDEINLVYQRDTRNGIRLTNRNKCSWDGYSKIKEDFEDWLFSKSSKRGDFKDNLDAIIYFYNEENPHKTLWDYIEEHGLQILDKFKHYKE